jgi:arylsulfatase A-like enzyme
MSSTAPQTSVGQAPRKKSLSPVAAILLAISIGLCAGYLDLVIIIVKKCWWNSEGYVRNARDFVWTVPLAHAVVLVAVALLVVVVNAVRTKGISLRAAVWLFATLGIWGALLRMPFYAACSLLLAAGLGRATSEALAGLGVQLRRLGLVLALLLGVLGLLAFFSSGLQSLNEHRTSAGLSPTPAGAPNVVLIVWDTVRAHNLSLYGYERKTTPNLKQWARTGVRYDGAVAPAPWTYPSHSSFFTGQWPYRLNSQWKFDLDDASPTLAEHLAAKGYQTAGFVANTNCCSYEGGLARGFAHFEDYVLTPRTLFSRIVPGKWVLEQVVGLLDFYDRKWVSLQSRGAHEINNAFLDWLGRRRSDRPFFAFLNYFDAHEPYIAPAKYIGRFGIRPVYWRDFQFLFDFIGLPKQPRMTRDILMARDCYDDCIAYLDEQLDRLLTELRGRGLLDSTVVIITSDHGEAFGDHGTTGHSYGVFMDEIGVPLVILAPGAPAGRVVKHPVTLRDIPATVVDLLGIRTGSPFPGRSLAAHWNIAPGDAAPKDITSPAFTEQAYATAFQAHEPFPAGKPPFQMSLVAGDEHYIRTASGAEQLFNLTTDPAEQHDLMNSPYGKERAAFLRRNLLDVLNADPGAAEVEHAYLERFRQELRADVQHNSSRRVADAR